LTDFQADYITVRSLEYACHTWAP